MTVPMGSRRLVVHGVDTFCYDVGSGDVPVICLHGNPDCADAWLPLLARSPELGRVIAPDLPCFGRSGRPSVEVFDASLDAYAAWFAALVDALGIDRYRLVVHDWGSIALAGAGRRPEQVERLVAIDAVPLASSYRWHWIARLLWRPRVVGEVGMTILNRWVIRTITRLQRPRLKPLDAALLDRMARYLDPGTKRAILRLYRSADPADLERHGAGLRAMRCPALLVWGRQDPYIGLQEMDVLAARLGGAVEKVVVEGGHWPMSDTPEVFERAVRFLTA
jgi:pimeloyl-ACP methyl ester carboxylesterase